MTIRGERIGRSPNKAFATPWEVCFDVAYPPLSMLIITNRTQGEGHRVRAHWGLSPQEPLEAERLRFPVVARPA